MTVIDFCLVRQLVCDPDTHYESLHLTWASKTSCNQRRGTTIFRPFKCLLSLLPLTQCLFPDRSGRSSVKGLLLQTCYQRVLEKGNPRLHDSRDAGKGLCQWPVFNAVQTLLLKTDLCSTIFHFLSLLRSPLSCWKWSCWTWEIPAPSSPQHSHLPTSLT